MMDRKQVLKILGSLPLFGGFLSTGLMNKISELDRPLDGRRDYFTELGVRTLINGRGDSDDFDWVFNGSCGNGCDELCIQELCQPE